MSGALSLACLLLVGALDRAGEAREQKEAVHRRLESQKAALALLQDEKVGVLEVLELYQGLAARVRARSRFVEREVRALEGQKALAELEASVAQKALGAELSQLSPRLLRMYRLNRQSPLAVLLPAQDFAAMVRRSRAYGSLMREDLKSLAEVRQVADFQRDALGRLTNLSAALTERLAAMKAEEKQTEAEGEELTDALTLIQAKASRSSRVAKELKVTEAQLTQLVAELTATPGESGFGALRGRLPLPVDGVVEVPFGRVVNPRFNTITAQKGMDIRARAGAPVRAVAPGKIVYQAFMHGYGNLLILDHGEGYHTLMAHLESFERGMGDEVQAGELLGEVGESGSIKGPYLYFEVRQRGLAVNPSTWLAKPPGGGD